MRKSAAQMAATIGLEADSISKRKTYIEQMTTYLNDRIRELNKVTVCMKASMLKTQRFDQNGLSSIIIMCSICTTTRRNRILTISVGQK